MMFKDTLRICAAFLTTAAMLMAVDGIFSIARATPSDDAELVARAAKAHVSLMRGDIDRYRQSVKLAPDFTLMDPFGGPVSGIPPSEGDWQRIGRFFRDGKAAKFIPLHTYATQDMVVIVANEHAHVAVGDLPAQDWSLRVTLVFRRDQEGWRLVHRHADPLRTAISRGEAARLAGARPDE